MTNITVKSATPEIKYIYLSTLKIGDFFGDQGGLFIIINNISAHEYECMRLDTQVRLNFSKRQIVYKVQDVHINYCLAHDPAE